MRLPGTPAVSVAAAALALAITAPAAAGAAKPYDLDGDGRQELVTGLPWWSDRGEANAGAVAVVRGSRSRVLGSRVLITASSLGVPGEGFDGFGSGLASGDFDGDGRADLAVGAPGGGDGGLEGDPGTVTVLYGSSGFPDGRRAVIAGPDRTGRPAYTGLGAALAAADLDRDGYADLVAGMPGADAREQEDYGSGALRVFFGGPAGLTTARARTIARPDRADASFGSVLALGDADRDGRLDVFSAAGGTPHWVDDPPVPGHVALARGGDDGPLTAAPVRGRMSGGPQSVAVGDVTGDGYPDVVLGVPVDRYVGEDETAPPGAVMVIRGSAVGPTGKAIAIGQRSPGVPGTAEAGDHFGAAVAVARVDRDHYADIIVGAPYEDGGRGRVTILRGGPDGYARAGNRAVDESTRGVPGDRRRWDRFGSALSVLDHDGDGRGDLSIAAPGRSDAGTITVLRGVRTRFSTAGAQRFDVAALGQRPRPGSGYGATRIGRVNGS